MGVDTCRLYAAPMEGITGYVYRNAHCKHFGGVDKYYTPFLTPKPKRGLNSREKNDILPEHNVGVPVVPQILTSSAEDFLRLAGQLGDLGYEEINLNLGCPSGTVVAKGKGSGFLAEPERLRRFLDVIFSKTDQKISVKTRLGVRDPQEMEALLAIYNAFPLTELIVHARVREDFYKKPANREAFREVFLESSCPLCYNGDVFCPEDYEALLAQFPGLPAVMLGRGFIRNPQIFEEIGGERERDLLRWQRFLADVRVGYEAIMSGERNVLFKMKEIWSYLHVSFPDGEKRVKKIKKAKNLGEYLAAERTFFADALGE